MDKFLKLITFSLFAALIVFASCGGDDDDDDNNDDIVDPVQDIVDDLIAGGGTWTVATGGVTLESVAAPDWENFQIDLAGTTTSLTFTTRGAADNTVWPTSGTWSFVDDSNGQKATRSGDNVEIDITASATSLLLQFDIAAGRSNGIEGRWSFTLEK